MDSEGLLRNVESDLAALRLMHLADSGLPIGGLAHSFGLESLVSRGLLTADDLPDFMSGFLDEVGLVEAVFCRQAFRLARTNVASHRVSSWLALNQRLGALKLARESRAGSASLGKNFLSAVAKVNDLPLLREALDASKRAEGLIHHSSAFGFACGALGFEEERTVLGFLHQVISSFVSACQRLLPLGQSAATRVFWELKPAMMKTARRSAVCAIDEAFCFTPLLDWGAMEHPALSTRLFIS